MNIDEIHNAAERLHQEIRGMPDPSMSNYKDLIMEYKRILSDNTVLLRELSSAVQALTLLPKE